MDKIHTLENSIKKQFSALISVCSVATLTLELRKVSDNVRQLDLCSTVNARCDHCNWPLKALFHCLVSKQHAGAFQNKELLTRSALMSLSFALNNES